MSSAGIDPRLSMGCLVCPPDKQREQWDVLHKKGRKPNYE